MAGFQPAEVGAVPICRSSLCLASHDGAQALTACGAMDSANGFYPLGWGFESLQADVNKICNNCKTEKPLEQFLLVPGKRVGTRGICSDCFAR